MWEIYQVEVGNFWGFDNDSGVVNELKDSSEGWGTCFSVLPSNWHEAGGVTSYHSYYSAAGPYLLESLF